MCGGGGGGGGGGSWGVGEGLMHPIGSLESYIYGVHCILFS